jgi:hypothetical protein
MGSICSAKRNALIVVKATLRRLPSRNDFSARRVPVRRNPTGGASRRNLHGA